MGILSFISRKIESVRFRHNAPANLLDIVTYVDENDLEIAECPEIECHDFPPGHEKAKAYSMYPFIKKYGSICKFAQSRPGLSIENSFKEYSMGRVSDDPVNWLSVVPMNSALCGLGYGDLFVIFEDDPEVLRQNDMLDQPIIDLNNDFNEYKAQRLLPKTIKPFTPEIFVGLIKVATDRSLNWLVIRDAHGKLERILQSNNCEKVAEFLRFLRERHFPNLNYSTDTLGPAYAIKEDIDLDYRDWYNEFVKIAASDKPEPISDSAPAPDRETESFVEPELIAQQIEFQKALEDEFVSQQTIVDEEEYAEDDYDEPER